MEAWTSMFYVCVYSTCMIKDEVQSYTEKKRALPLLQFKSDDQEYEERAMALFSSPCQICLSF